MSNSYVVGEPASLFDFLCARFADTKRIRLRQWLKHGAILVNGERVTYPKHLLSTGDQIDIRPRKEKSNAESLRWAVRIVHEDEAVIVIDKPAGLLSMASDAERSRTAYAFLMEYVRAHVRQSKSRIWIVHRLDRETSGLMVFARTEEAKNALQSTWQQTVKRYMAIVEGRPPESAGTIRSYLDESQPHKVYTTHRADLARLAVTHYRTLATRADRTLLEVTLETGRRNQIRVHLADIGCPVLGDDKYGAASGTVKRLALHASFLQFIHPTTGETRSFESPIPDPLRRIVPHP